MQRLEAQHGIELKPWPTRGAVLYGPVIIFLERWGHYMHIDPSPSWMVCVLHFEGLNLP